MNTETKMKEFGKLEVGGKFYLSDSGSRSHSGLADTAYYTKTISQKDANGSWFNAKTAFGMLTFVQYDKRVWVK